MAKLGTIQFTGQSGAVFKFEIYPSSVDFNEVGGVYFVTKRTENSEGGFSHSRIYVGQTSDLSTRFDDHHRKHCFEKHQANCICVYVEEDERTRLSIEKDLRRKHNPPCNRE